MRKPLVAGQFYRADKDALIDEIEEAFEKGIGFPKPRKNNNVKAAIMPHAGYFFSGKAAARAIKEIAETDAHVFVILGVNHGGIGQNSTTKDDFKTPLGTAKIDVDLQKMLIKECKLDVDEEARQAHNREHSIEVILPFLQYMVRDFTFVPIIVSEDEEMLGKAIRKAVSAYEKKKKKKVILIASGDMTHYGASYRYIPFHEDIKKNLYDLDRKAIGFILNRDADGFLNFVKETGATICGRSTFLTLLHYLGKEDVTGKLLDYYTSADVMGDYHSAVGYAAIVFK